MKFLHTITTFVQELDEQHFKRYLLIACAAATIIFGLGVYFYYSTTDALLKQLEDVNDVREGDLKKTLTRSKELRQAGAAIDATLAKTPDFKIKGYFLDLMKKLNLESMMSSAEPSHVDRDKDYREITLKATFTDMNMKQLTELLRELEKSDRISTKELEITQSKRSSAINVVLTIGTLEPQKAMLK